ncbi:unnamed protein product, partial [Rotaria sp. Silwood2]
QQEEVYERRILIDDMQQARKYDLIEKQKQAKEREILFVQQEQIQSQLELEKQDAAKFEDKNHKRQ